MRKLTVYITILVLFASCGEYQKVLKSTDRELQYEMAKSYFKDKKFSRAMTLFDELVPFFRGTDKAEESLYFQAMTYFMMKDYLLASHYFGQLAKQYSTGPYTEECYYKQAYALYLYSPKPRLDQEYTFQAIDAFQTFLELYPSTSKRDQINEYILDLQDKLAYKSYLNAKLYYDLGNYLGNNYKAAVIEAQNSLKQYPDTRYREELSFLILKSKYIQAANSVKEKMADRYRDAIDEYYAFKNEFPESKYEKEAERMFSNANRVLSLITNN